MEINVQPQSSQPQKSIYCGQVSAMHASCGCSWAANARNQQGQTAARHNNRMANVYMPWLQSRLLAKHKGGVVTQGQG
jgi:hypothetical protein